MRHYADHEFRDRAGKGLIEGICSEGAARYEAIITEKEEAMAAAVTVDSIKNLRAELQKRIAQEIRNFEDVTGCTVDMVLLQRHDPMGKKSRIVGVEVEVTL